MLNITESLAKILSQENLTVVQKKVDTAYFDIKNRTLVLPVWKDMEPAVEKMLTFHEVSHALFTPHQYMDEVESNPKISDILNVVEDPRVERLFKERYPGARKDFNEGYSILRKNDFFGLSDLDVNELNFVDRLNVFFKVGVISGVKFSKAEYELVKRAQEIVTFQEALQLSKDILEFIKEEVKRKNTTLMDQLVSMKSESGEDEGEDGDYEDGDEEVEVEVDDNATVSASKQSVGNTYKDYLALEDQIKSKTQKSADEKIKSMTSSDSVEHIKSIYRYSQDYIIPYKEVLEKIKTITYGKDLSPELVKEAQTIIRNKERDVNHMVSMFQMKKAADEFSAQRITKTGKLNLDKISLYQLSDNIFKKKIEVPEGKNHGFVFLLDFSNSMAGSRIKQSLLQVITMVMFCRKVQVPHRVFAFVQHPSNASYNLSLVELFSSEMNATDFNKMLKYSCFSRIICSAYPMYNTPLNESLMFMADYLLDFKTKYRLQKLNFTVFTDGQATDDILGMGYNTPKKIFVYTDPLNKKNYILPRRMHTYAATSCLLFNVIKGRDSSIIVNSYFLGSYSGNCNAMGFTFNEEKAKEYSKNGFTAVKGNGRDAAYFVSQQILGDNQDAQLILDSSMSAAQISSIMKKKAKSSSKGKLLLQHFIETIS